MQATVWDFAGDDFRLPGGRGRMEQTVLPGGLTLYRSEFHMDEDCLVDARYDADDAVLGCVTLLAGRSVIETPDGARHEMRPDRALFLRVNEPGLRFVVPGGQVVRHVGVDCALDALRARLGAIPRALECFERPGVIARPVAIGTKLRRLQARMFSSFVEGPARTLALEGLSAQILARLIDLVAKGRNDRPPPTPWERQALEWMCERIAAEPGSAHRAADLGRRAGLTHNRVLELFRAVHGVSFPDYLRRERLTAARRMIEAGAPIKAAAAAVGYAHVSNFTSAYRALFGETPGQTRRLAGMRAPRRASA